MTRPRGRPRRPRRDGPRRPAIRPGHPATPTTMSPPNAENDPVHKGLQRLGDEVDQASPPAGAGRQPGRAGPARTGPPDRRGATRAGKGGRRKGAHAAPKRAFAAPDRGLRRGHARAGDRPAGRGHRRVRLVPQPRDPPDRPPQPDLVPGQGRGRRHGEHLDDRLHVALRPDRAEPGLRALLARGQRGQQRRGDDPPPQPDHPHRLHPFHPPRPVRPQRAIRRRQQDRRRALPGAGPTHRRHRGGLRHSDPALRGAELRQLHQRGERTGRDQDVLPRARLRRVLGAEHPDDGLHRTQRDPGPPGGPGPPRAVQGSGRHHRQSQLLAPGGAERHRPDPARPRVPARARHRGQGEGAQQSPDRPEAGVGCGRASSPWTRASRPRR